MPALRSPKVQQIPLTRGEHATLHPMQESVTSAAPPVQHAPVADAAAQGGPNRLLAFWVALATIYAGLAIFGFSTYGN